MRIYSSNQCDAIEFLSNVTRNITRHADHEQIDKANIGIK